MTLRRLRRVYLAGPINACTDEETKGWRNKFTEEHPEVVCVDPTRRDYRGIEDTVTSAQIVEDDIADIESCDVVVANCWKPGYGTAMELVYAYERGIRTVVVAPSPVSPWLRYHADSLVSSLDEVEL